MPGFINLDFEKFVRRHKGKNKSANSLITQYRTQGGKISTKKAYEIVRKVYNVNKGESLGKKMTPQKKSTAWFLQSQKINNSPQVQEWLNSVRKMTGSKGTKFIQVRAIIKNDEYTQKQRFSFLIPWNGSSNIDLKKFLNKLNQNIRNYYTRLSAMYNNESNSASSVLKDLDSAIKELNELNRFNMGDLIDTFAKYGINFTEISPIEIVTREE